MANIFISHSTIDKALADYICNAFEERGLSCWIAPRNIVPGSEWAASITEAIGEADVLFVLFSKNAMQSTQVSKEIGIADRKGKYIIPYKIDDAEPEGAYDYYLASCHWIMADPQSGDYKIEELCETIKRVVKEREEKRAAETVQEPASPVVQQPAVQQPIAQPVVQQPIPQPVQQPIVHPIVRQSVPQPVQQSVSQPMNKQPVQQQRPVQQQISKQPGPQRTVQQPVVQRTVHGDNTAKKPNMSASKASPAKKERRRLLIGGGIAAVCLIGLIAVVGIVIGVIGKSYLASSPSNDYEYIDNGESVTIIQYIGSGTEIVVPAEIDDKPVTALSNNVFYGCSEIVSIELPDTVTEIPDFAFYKCTNLTEVIIPEGVTRIGQHAFEECESLTYVELPYSVEKIDNFAFNNCSNLTGVKMSSNVTVIGNYAFSTCEKLESITLPGNLTYLGDMAFAYCEGLDSVTLPDSIKRLSSSAFSGCYEITVYYKNQAYSNDISELVELIISEN